VATHPVDGTAIEQRHIYVAPPDHHMLLEQGRIRVIRGPRENRHQPAIDPLFRSAGVAYGPRVVGVILTGSLDDGTAGLEAIKQRGGVAVVQNYTEALFSSMPHSAVEHVKVDYVLSLSAIAEKLRELAHEVVKESEESPVSRNMETEVSMAKMQIPPENEGEQVGTPSAYSCPECGGVLWEIHDGELLRFRCRVGHAFSVESMMAEQTDTIEEAMWIALKTLEESVSISHRMASQARQRGHTSLVRRLEERGKLAQQRVELLMNALQKSDTNPPEVQDGISEKVSGSPGT